MERPGNRCKSIKNTSLAEQHEGIHSEIKIHVEVQPMVSEVEAAFWKIARRVEWMKCVRSCSEQLVCDPFTSALYENLVKWRMASCLGKDSLYHAELKEDRRQGSNYRTIYHICEFSKVTLRIIIRRLKQRLEVSDHQAGFRGGKGIRKQIFNLRQILQKCQVCWQITSQRCQILVLLDRMQLKPSSKNLHTALYSQVRLNR